VLLGTEAASALTLYLSKITTFDQMGALPRDLVFRGLTIGAALMLGAFVGKLIVLRVSTAWLHRAIDAVLICAAGGLLIAAYVK
jgi:uncharacterized protein